MEALLARDEAEAKRKIVSVVETLLLIDGDTVCRNALKFMLEVNGYRVVEASHGTEALRLLDVYGERIHMALCAVDLPDMSGPEWLGQVRALAPELPVVMLKEWDRMESSMMPVGPWYSGLPVRPPAPNRLLDKIRLELDEHFFRLFGQASAA